MYIIQEIQTSEGQTALLPAITQADWNEAISVFHQKASYAAISSVEIHTIMVYDEWGHIVETINFTHDTPSNEE